VLVLHSWRGLDAFSRGVCERLAAAGPFALAAFSVLVEKFNIAPITTADDDLQAILTPAGA
jgi:dienelactone hydrolase